MEVAKDRKEAGEEGVHSPSDTPLTDKVLFPFSAVVNQEKAKEALLFSLINPAVHGVLLLGEKGTGKTTLVRSLSTLLPERRVIELPLGSGEEMVLGTVDAAKSLSTGKLATKAGILARADGQVLYIDEVNLLPDHLMDVILDAAATGYYRMEREGVSRDVRARFILVGSMNPEEGWLRPQLLDRFGLAVHVKALSTVEGRAEVFRRAQAFETAPGRFEKAFRDQQHALAQRLRRAMERVQQVAIPDAIVERTLQAILLTGVYTHRAELATLRAAQAKTAWEGRASVTWQDVTAVMPLALQHRLPSTDMQRQVTWEEIERRALKGKESTLDRKKGGWLSSPFFHKKKAPREERK